ncbi:MAG: hypothetical protein RIR79_1698 [Pseudomonadota bacterium]|jgi:glutathione synthase/RimK-type ligase-like ATP-grasp enzyme
MILLIGDEIDPHLIELRKSIVLNGELCEIFSTTRDSLLNTSFYFCSSGDEADLAIYQRGKEFFASSIKVAFCMSPMFVMENSFSSQEQKFWFYSWRECLFGFYSILAERKALIQSSITLAIENQNKVKFLFVAKRLGLNVPISFIGNSKLKIHEFLKLKDSNVLKTLHQLQLFYKKEKTMLLTTKVAESDFSKYEEEHQCPLFLQKFIDKKYDLRLVVIGGDIFAFKIDATNSVYGAVDWRAYDLPNTIHEVIDISDDFKSDIRDLMSALDLEYACIDVCVDNDDSYWVLDVNPFGKYLWIEKLLGFDLTQKIALYIISRIN